MAPSREARGRYSLDPWGSASSICIVPSSRGYRDPDDGADYPTQRCQSFLAEVVQRGDAEGGRGITPVIQGCPNPASGARSSGRTLERVSPPVLLTLWRNV